MHHTPILISFFFLLILIVRKKNDVQKKITNEKYAVKAEILMKTKSFNDSVKRLAFSAGQRPIDAE